jgi:hypothetical protein
MTFRDSGDDRKEKEASKKEEKKSDIPPELDPNFKKSSLV